MKVSKAPVQRKHRPNPAPCKACGAARAPGYYHALCPACKREAARAKYHGNAEARAQHLAAVVGHLVRRRFPEADTGLSNAVYAGALLQAKACTYCGQPNDGTHPFNLDHRVALTLGGRHELANLEPCCEPCNRAKRDMPAGEYRAWLAGVVERGQNVS